MRFDLAKSFALLPSPGCRALFPLQDMSSTPILDPTWVAQQALRVNEGQVAGHPGSLQSLRGPNGEALIIKQSLDGEVAFYEMLRAADSSNTAAPLLEWIPRYYGSLPPASPDDKPSVILEDLLSKYKRPNVLDIKLGTQLWDDKSSEDKKRRMEEASRNTTSFETGIRLTGWRVSTTTVGDLPATKDTTC